MTARKHVPGFIDDSTPSTVHPASTDELLAVPWVNEWRTVEGFHRFSRDGSRLMAELNGGRRWYVVAHLEDAETPDLPNWEPR